MHFLAWRSPGGNPARDRPARCRDRADTSGVCARAAANPGRRDGGGSPRRRRARRADVGRARRRSISSSQTDPEEGEPATLRTTVRVMADAIGARDRHRVRRSRSGRHRQLQRAARRGARRRGSRPHRARSVSRRPLRIRLRDQPERRALRRADRAGRRGRQLRLGRHLGRGDAAARRRDGAPRSRIPIQTLSFKPDLREWHFNVRTPRPAPPRDDALGLPGAAVSGHADQPRRRAHRPARFRSRPRPQRAAGDHGRRRHSGASEPTSTASFIRASTSRSGSAPTCSPR